MNKTEIENLLLKYYGYRAEEIRETKGGTVGYTYAVDEKYFLKIYDTNLVITARCTEKLHEQLFVLDYLRNKTKLGDRICYPIKTSCGDYFFKERNLIGVLFNLIDGAALGYDRLYTSEELEQLSVIVRDMHGIDVSEIAEYCPVERFDLEFCGRLIDLVENGAQRLPKRFAALAQENLQLMKRKTTEAQEGAERIKALGLPFVLCHTDIHGGNIMCSESGRLYLVDWENMLLAPKEADLFSFADDYPLELFAERVNPAALLYYTIRRDLEDIWEFLNSTAHGEYDDTELDVVYGHLKRICGHLKETDNVKGRNQNG